MTCTESDAMAILQRWVDLDSPSGDRALLDVFAWRLAGDLADLGWTVRLVETDAGAQVRAQIRGGGTSRTVLLCHHDTVFGAGEARHRPFSVSDGRALGPGVADMKGGILVAALAGVALQRSAEAYGLVELWSVPDEETREGAFPGVEELRGAHAVLCLEAGGPDGAVVNARKGGRWLTGHATGRAAHAGVEPEAGRNAVTAVAQVIVATQQLDGQHEGLTVNVTGVRGGGSINTIPARAEFDVDIRAFTASEIDWAARTIAEFPVPDGISASYETKSSFPPLPPEGGTMHLLGLARTAAEAAGYELRGAPRGGASDASWAASIGVPVLDGLGPVGSDDHTPAEWIEIGSVARRVRLVADLLRAIEDAPAAGQTADADGETTSEKLEATDS